MEALDNLTKLVMDNMDAGKLPAWVAGRLIQAIQDRDKEIKKWRGVALHEAKALSRRQEILETVMEGTLDDPVHYVRKELGEVD